MNQFAQYHIGDSEGKPFVKSLEEMSPLLIGGASGSGKSFFLQKLIDFIIENNTPTEAKLLLLDPKRVELYDYVHEPHLYSPIIIDCKQAINTLNTLIKENNPIPVYIFIDEFSIWTYDSEFKGIVEKIAREGKNHNLYLFVSTQCLDQEVVPNTMIDSFNHIMGMRVMGQEESLLLVSETGLEKLPVYGEAQYYEKECNRKTKVKLTP